MSNIGDKTRVTLVPANYTRTTTSPGTSQEDLIAHLKGIDNVLGNVAPADIFSGPGTEGLVPDPVTGLGKFLKDNGTWDNPSVGLGITITKKTTTPINVAVTEDVILVELAAPGPVVVNLPQISTHDTKYVVIKDKTGDAGTNNITINAFGGETIDGVATKIITVDYGSITLAGEGAEWSIV